MNKPKDWWGDPNNAELWIEQNKIRTNSSKINTTNESTKIVLSEIKKKNFKTILEVGAGDGRIIGPLSKKYKCYSTDINPELSKFVKDKYPLVNVSVNNITNLDFPDNHFDLVYTYQVLQHIHPEDIEKALSELQRVSKKEVWMWEGVGKLDYKNGDKTHNAHNGSWVWHIDKMINCYSITIPENKNVKLRGQRLYKIKV